MDSQKISQNVNLGDAIALPPTKPIPIWRFVLPLLMQTVLILTVPAQAVYTHLTGKTVILQTIPVDPYSILTGYSQSLTYNISRQEDLKKLPGWEELVKKYPGSNKQHYPLAQGTNLYVILQAESNTASIPKAWKPVRVSEKLPTSLAANQIALQGSYRYGTVVYGLETYYIPEDQKEQINKEISQIQQSTTGEQQPIVVEVKVDARGKAVPISMWVRERNYRF
ncbi:GDYXXLXY domain-containing protein [Iningainema tapete]|uniref:GDYXXLXY domain-containing protein n=1 Tax=Iningainema tapete BLCC-T55 TaxID=2748662 RepID=A0A8J6XNV1_9CYAN|nr:GDYXXLXY domain-containing protein [Iningainema tapete]MBD2775339.1 GDYXXLXY domain-containing protein [Iningainema tapete BLCC-T55]